MIEKILARFEAEKSREKPYSVTNILWDRAISIVKEVAKEHGRKLNRCDTCIHYTSEEIVPPICYFCCKGMEDNYKEREEKE